MFDAGDKGLGGPCDQTLALVDLAEPSMEGDKELVNYLEHASSCEGLILVLDTC
jgi:hypothetical protein